jgi:aryl-alcohol dehydrogenase-like predicted oxidoreductase
VKNSTTACRGDFSAAHTRRSVERSLQRLETDFIDWCWCIPTATTWRSSTTARSRPSPTQAEGKIRGFGFSGKTVDGGLKALEQGDCAMVTYNLNEQARSRSLTTLPPTAKPSW